MTPKRKQLLARMKSANNRLNRALARLPEVMTSSELSADDNLSKLTKA
jgi:hypothetical protein